MVKITDEKMKAIFDGQNGAGLQGQANLLERATDIIQTQWHFVHVACVHELSNLGLIEH